ncbi:MAG TPA: hypothetical protein VHD87_08205 [Acidimicrobiales bacterium]|nr:hypothetical protein [Acidimicrobiales bacterium]
MGIVGAELASLTRLEAAVARHGAALEQLRAALAAEIEATDWQGNAAERFRAAWREDHEPSLRRLEAALHDAALEVGRRRAAIEAAGA